jgi:hypothetical protein
MLSDRTTVCVGLWIVLSAAAQAVGAEVLHKPLPGPPIIAPTQAHVVYPDSGYTAPVVHFGAGRFRPPCQPSGLGPGVPRFHWGYFGAPRCGRKGCRTGYYREYFQWTFRPGP